MASQESETLYQSGTESGGVYGNSSYNYQDYSAVTMSASAGGPGYSTSGTLTPDATTTWRRRDQLNREKRPVITKSGDVGDQDLPPHYG